MYNLNMPKKLYKILAVLIAVFLVVLFFLFYFQLNQPKLLEVVFFNVGQGDAILVKSPYGQNILIDGGPDTRVIKELEKALPWWDKKIDLAILTHPHDDHLFGLIEVGKRYDLLVSAHTGVVFENPNYQAWLGGFRNQDTALILIDRPQTITLGSDCYLEIIYPRFSWVGKKADNINNFSIVARLVYRDNSFLFVGDLETEGEADLLASGADIKAQVLKVGHHGSETASSQRFLDKIKPQYAVIQVGQNNKFGLPSLRIIKRLERLGAMILRTDEQGRIVFLSDGRLLTVK